LPKDSLTPLEIRRAKPKGAPYKLRDGKGLYLDVRPSGAKIWRYRYRIDGTENLYTLGEFGDRADQLTLGAARSERDVARKLVKQGVHPGHHRKALVRATVSEGKNTFRAVAAEWLEESKPHWSQKYYANVKSGLDNAILPAIGDVPIRSVKPVDVAAILKKYRNRASMASMLRLWCGSVFRYAIINQRAEADPTYVLRGSIKKPAVRHHKPLPLSEIPALVSALDQYSGYRGTAIALRLLLLSFVRPGELCPAEWDEFDLDNALWRLPAGRMKMGEPHLVPLSRQAVTLLRELKGLDSKAHTKQAHRLFPSPFKPRGSISRGSLSKALLELGYRGKFSPHGFRATASTSLNEMGFRPDVIERQLAHAERNQSRASYNQGQYLEERRKMMQTWADVIDAQVAEASQRVVPLKRQSMK
jgi:integrase